MFIGEYIHTIDIKGRYIPPARFREELGDDFVITKGLDSCLFLYTRASWQLKIEELARLSSTNADARRFSRNFFASALEAAPDKQCRVLIPPGLRAHAQLTRDIVTIGVVNRLEIWDKERWEAYNAASAEEYEAVAEKLADIRL
ncbi:MAG: division/cell wall cluster transcriptional repressor MraZ [Clostridiales bacterium]|nr:division/cell wall cluster transcriptional repressor MraZ [Clostridiales bacterium]